MIPDKYGPTDMRGPGVEAAREAGLILPMDWPAGLVLEEFKSCVIYNEQLKLTQMLLENCTTVWHPWRERPGWDTQLTLVITRRQVNSSPSKFGTMCESHDRADDPSPHPDGASPAPFSFLSDSWINRLNTNQRVSTIRYRSEVACSLHPPSAAVEGANNLPLSSDAGGTRGFPAYAS